MRTHEPTRDLLNQMIAGIPEEVRLQCDMSDTIAGRIDSILKERGMTQKQFAQLVHHSQGEVSRWLSGTHNFTLSTLAQISVALGVNVLTFPSQRIKALNNEKRSRAGILTLPARLLQSLAPLLSNKFFADTAVTISHDIDARLWSRKQKTIDVISFKFHDIDVIRFNIFNA